MGVTLWKPLSCNRPFPIEISGTRTWLRNGVRTSSNDPAIQSVGVWVALAPGAKRTGAP